MTTFCMWLRKRIPLAYTSKQELKGEAIFWLAHRLPREWMVLPTVLGPQIAINYEDNPPPRYAYRPVWSGQSLSWDSHLRWLWAVSRWRLKPTRKDAKVFVPFLLLHRLFINASGDLTSLPLTTLSFICVCLLSLPCYTARGLVRGALSGLHGVYPGLV